ncbi:MAG TPA: bifunctional phosphopantothenoylcysteine decarboxylase/phosphopantothenate--cysteine ligase CoaBC, partial [Candidatus Norongarragalinales archaeon]|nr:bifunctional phosphopantothenoylcysteine decarboxylase/phosphopantothenate--cysteine ligase CoaBC [Candidatus Norongarragalinales archaeon]
AFSGPVFIAPAMNDVMYENQVLRRNVDRLEKIGYKVIRPDVGDLACGRIGQGRMADPSRIVSFLENRFEPKDLSGKNVLITAGPTRAYLDPVRFLTNASSGIMGIAFAKNAQQRGAQVTLILGPTSEKNPEKTRVVRVTTTRQMFKEVQKKFKKAHLVIGAAAPCDFEPKRKKHKIKRKNALTFSFEKTPDILAWCGRHKKKQVLVGFALETEPLAAEARRKLLEKNLDAVILNTPRNIASGKASGTVFFKNKTVEIPCMDKSSFSRKVLNAVLQNVQKEKKP